METFIKRPGRSDPSPPTAAVRDRDDSVRVRAHRRQRRGRPRLLTTRTHQQEEG